MFGRRRRPEPTPATVTAVVLAGGASRRFGATKGLATLRDRPLVAWVASAAGAVAGHVVLVLAPDEDEAPWRKALGGPEATTRLQLVHDAAYAQGPVAGLEAALPAVPGPFVMLLAVDMPLLRPDLLLGLFDRLVGHDAVAFHLDGWWRPFPSLWRTASLREATPAARAEGIGSLHGLLDRVDARPLGGEFLALFGAAPEHLASINTPQQLDAAAERLARA